MPETAIADLHCDTVLRVRGGADLRSLDTLGQVDIPRLQAGNVGVQGFACFVEAGHSQPFKAVIDLLDVVEALCASNPESLEIVRDSDAITRTIGAGRIGLLLTVENGHAIENSLSKLEEFRERGVRAMTLVHTRNLDWIESCAQDKAGFEGITSFGEQVVDAMCELGIVVDVSHAHERAVRKVAPLMSRRGRPLVATHSNAFELCRHPRNLTDEQIRMIAGTGGMIGVNFFPPFLDEGSREAWDKQKTEELKHPSTSAATIADHIDHIVRLVGDEYVGFGSDFDGMPVTPVDVTGSDCYPVILAELRRRAYEERSIEKIAFGNALRVLSAYDVS